MAMLLFPGCSREDQQPETPRGTSLTDKAAARQIFRSIPGTEAQTIIKQNRELLLLDVRTPQERRQMRIVGSLLVPLGDVIRGKLAIPPEKPVMLLCAVGGRSYVAAQILSKMGYREVYNLDGGIEAWRRAGLPLEYGPEPADHQAASITEKSEQQ